MIDNIITPNIVYDKSKDKVVISFENKEPSLNVYYLISQSISFTYDADFIKQTGTQYNQNVEVTNDNCYLSFISTDEQSYTSYPQFVKINKFDVHSSGQGFVVSKASFNFLTNKYTVEFPSTNLEVLLYKVVDSPSTNHTAEWLANNGGRVYLAPIQFENEDTIIAYAYKDKNGNYVENQHLILNKVETTTINVKDIIPLDNHFVYFKVPTVYYGIYLQLLNKLGEVGKDLLDECKASCKGSNQQLLACWNMFHAACAEYIKNPQSSTARTLIKYIVAQLHLEEEDKDYYQYSIYTGMYHLTTGDWHEFETVQVADLDVNEKAICSDLELKFEFNHTDDIHFIILPENVSLSKVYYKSGGIKTYLFDDEKDINEYNVRTVWSDNKKYNLYWYYSPVGRIDEIINVKCKNV